MKPLNYHSFHNLKNREINRHLKRRKPLTYVIGGRCNDGVVIVADRLGINSDGTIIDVDKIFNPSEGIVAAIAGYSSMIYNFSEEIKLCKKSGKIKTLYDWKNAIEDIVLKLNLRYKERLGEEPLEALVSIKNPENNKAELFSVSDKGVAEPIQGYFAIGSGKYFGEAFIKPAWYYLTKDEQRKLWEENFELKMGTPVKFLEPNMINFMSLLAFPIYYIQMHGILTSVGRGLDVWLIPDTGKERHITKEEEKKLYEKVWEMLSETRLLPFFIEKNSLNSS